MRRRGWLLLLVMAFLALGADGCRTKETVPATQTEIMLFEVVPARISRGDGVTLRWEARNPGSHEDRVPCSITRRVDGEAPDEPFEVSCSGSMTVVPPAPPTAAHVRYQLNVLKRSLPAVDPYLTRVVTVEFGSLVTIEPDGATLWLGASQVFTAIVAGDHGLGVTWSASCGSISGAGQTITYTAPAEAGSCSLTATSVADASVRASVVVQVVSPIVSVTIDQDDVALSVGDSVTLTVTVEAEDGAVESVDWESDDVTVASIDAGGTVSGIAPGTATIAATSSVDRTRSDARVVSVAATPEPGALLWSHVIAGASEERAGGVAVDGDGNVIVAFSSDGAFADHPVGGFDVVVAKYDPQGVALWFRQFGTDAADFAADVAVDVDGNVLVTGSTAGSFDGTPAGSGRVFVAKLGPAGDLRWWRQFGTDTSDAGRAIGADAVGNVYVAGTLYGTIEDVSAIYAFVAKLEPDGGEVWTRLFGHTSGSGAQSLGVNDVGTVVVGAHEYRNPTVRCFDTFGNERWSLHLNTYTDAGGTSIDDDENVYVAGAESDRPTHDPNVAFLRKYDGDGVLVWSRSLGPEEGSRPWAVAVDSHGNALVVGTTSGPMGGTNPDGAAFVTKHDPDGNRVWIHQFDPNARYLAVGPDGTMVVSATGVDDVYVWKFAP